MKQPVPPKPPKPKAPTLKEKVQIYEALLHRIQFHCDVTGRPEAVREIVRRVCNWSRAHRHHLHPNEVQQRVNEQLQALRELP